MLPLIPTPGQQGKGNANVSRDALYESVRWSRRRWRTAVKKVPLSDGSWCYSRPARRDDAAQGWKIHVTATVISAPEIFARVQPILRKHDALFKVTARLELLAQLNTGLPNFSQVGKFLTVYPRTEGDAVALAHLLHRATRGLSGPDIPYDARYRRNSLVYYRYGVFRGSAKNLSGVIRGPNGKQYQDKRALGAAVPRWLKDPFNKARAKLRKWKGPIGVEFLAFKAKVQRGKGGVYEAVDLSVSPARLVIIKEGRRHGETDWQGRDGYARIKHEACVLRALRGAGVPVPEIFREFSQNGNRYLVLEKITGRPLIPANKMQPVKISWRRAAKILVQLSPILSRMHQAGWVWRDCKPSHIFLHRGEVRVIDFEGACRISEKAVLPWGSQNYSPRIYHKKFCRRPGLLEDDYALGVIAFQFGTGKFPPPRRAPPRRCLQTHWLSRFVAQGNRSVATG